MNRYPQLEITPELRQKIKDNFASSFKEEIERDIPGICDLQEESTVIRDINSQTITVHSLFTGTIDDYPIDLLKKSVKMGDEVVYRYRVGNRNYDGPNQGLGDELRDAIKFYYKEVNELRLNLLSQSRHKLRYLDIMREMLSEDLRDDL